MEQLIFGNVLFQFTDKNKKSCEISFSANNLKDAFDKLEMWMGAKANQCKLLKFEEKTYLK